MTKHEKYVILGTDFNKEINMFDVIGWIGMVLFLINYLAVSNGKMKPTGRLYNGLQIVAAAGIAISLLPAQAWPTITLEVFFIGVGLWAIFK